MSSSPRISFTRRALAGASLAAGATLTLGGGAASTVSPSAGQPARLAPASRDRIGPRAPRKPKPADGTIFVATDGSDRNGAGSEARPWATIQRAYEAAGPGDVVFLRGGTYSVTEYVMITKRASRRRRLVIASYPGEWAVLDFSRSTSGLVRVEGARHHVIRDLEIRNSPGQGIFVTGADTRRNAFVNVVARDSNGSGFQVYQGSRNRFFECLAVFTRSPDVPGDADGFGSVGRGGPSSHNSFYRCVAVDAPDDGFDSWEGDHTTWIACWAIRAGIFGGNGNGFKLGPGPGAPNTIWADPPPPDRRCRTDNRVRFSVAMDCTETGFDGNGGMDTEFLHNTSVGNRTAYSSYPADDSVRGENLLVNNLGGSDVYLDGAYREQRNSWNQGFTASTADFVSVDAPPTSAFLGITGRQAYRLLTRGDYADLLRLRPGRAAVDAGATVDVSRIGPRPDLGAFEVGLTP